MHEVIKRDRVRVQGEPPARQAPPAATHRAAGPIELVRAQGRIVAIRLTCRCGEVSVLEVEYENESSEET